MLLVLSLACRNLHLLHLVVQDKRGQTVSAQHPYQTAGRLAYRAAEFVKHPKALCWPLL